MSAPVEASGPWPDGPAPGATPPELSLVVVTGAGASDDELDVVGLVLLAEDVGCELEEVALEDELVGAVEDSVGLVDVVELVDVDDVVLDVVLDDVVLVDVVLDDVALDGSVVVEEVDVVLDVLDVGSVLDVVVLVVLVELVGSVDVVVPLVDVNVVLVGVVGVVVGVAQSGRSPVNG